MYKSGGPEQVAVGVRLGKWQTAISSYSALYAPVMPVPQGEPQ